MEQHKRDEARKKREEEAAQRERDALALLAARTTHQPTSDNSHASAASESRFVESFLASPAQRRLETVAPEFNAATTSPSRRVDSTPTPVSDSHFGESFMSSPSQRRLESPETHASSSRGSGALPAVPQLVEAKIVERSPAMRRSSQIVMESEEPTNNNANEQSNRESRRLLRAVGGMTDSELEEKVSRYVVCCVFKFLPALIISQTLAFLNKHDSTPTKSSPSTTPTITTPITPVGNSVEVASREQRRLSGSINRRMSSGSGWGRMSGNRNAEVRNDVDSRAPPLLQLRFADESALLASIDDVFNADSTVSSDNDVRDTWSHLCSQLLVPACLGVIGT
jgi:hypothetical protein